MHAKLRVLDEHKTMDAVANGKSISRYGDGEHNLMCGKTCISQKHDPRLKAELLEIIKAPLDRCIVGVPQIGDSMPEKKKVSWRKWLPDLYKYCDPAKQYYSAFITRPDQIPEIDTHAFFDRIIELWRGKDIALVWGGYRSLYPDFCRHTGAKSVYSILCSSADAYSQIDYYEAECVRSGCQTILLCCGATATVLAHRLSKLGRHAIDIGHCAMFWRDHPARPKDITPPSDKVSEHIQARGKLVYVQQIAQWRPAYEKNPINDYMQEAHVAKRYKADPGEAIVLNNAGAGPLAEKLARYYRRVYAFEQDPGLYGSLRRNIRCRNIMIFRDGIGNKIGDIGHGIFHHTLESLELRGDYDFIDGRLP